MHRLDFLKINALAGLGLGVLPFQNFDNPITIEFLTGKHNPYLNDTGIIHNMAYKAYLDMHSAALKEGIDIRIVSGFRSFDRQLSIWNRKYLRFQNQGLKGEDIIKKIITYSTIPGTSRHHWGTDIDIIDARVKQPNNGLLNENNYHGNGAFCQLQEWMQDHAHKFGFYLTYTANYHRTGFAYEPWHYSYQPLSKAFLKAYLKLNLKDFLDKENIEGKAYLDQNCLMSYFQTHLCGINPTLLP